MAITNPVTQLYLGMVLGVIIAVIIMAPVLTHFRNRSFAYSALWIFLIGEFASAALCGALYFIL